MSRLTASGTAFLGPPPRLPTDPDPSGRAVVQIGLLYRIFEQLGTPTLEQWHDLPGLAHFSEQFPKWQAKPMSQVGGQSR